ncbi:hypothetical protein OHC33_008173 [Knufia fluminis]|uniref:Uncharacterized protein n=1 Tax=Knufia fluminis TaxID=191047 RepID=A0AAN8EJ71_9EURO|nr:hypothetical protein OHC33_008173 [Knufia fluminis]
MPALLVSAEGEGPAVEYCASKESGGACHTEAFADGKCIALQDPEHTGIKGSSFTVLGDSTTCSVYASADCDVTKGTSPPMVKGGTAFFQHEGVTAVAFKCKVGGLVSAKDPKA